MANHFPAHSKPDLLTESRLFRRTSPRRGEWRSQCQFLARIRRRGTMALFLRRLEMPPFEWVPAPRWRRESGRVVVLEANPEAVRPALSVQPAWNHGRGIVRGHLNDGVLLEDHICEILDDSGQLIDLGMKGIRISGADEMRAQVWTAERHLAAYQEAHPDERIVAWAGNGNLLCNPHFVAFDGSAGANTLYRIGSELSFLGRTGRGYSCLIVRKPQYAPRVSIEKVHFETGDGRPQAWSARDDRITDEVDFATFGQLIVENGRPVDSGALARMAREGQFYDLRHLFLFGRIEIDKGRRIDLGLGAFWDGAGNMNARVVEQAFNCEQVSTNVSRFREDLVHTAMSAKGHFSVPDPRAVGQYSLRSGYSELSCGEEFTLTA